MIFFNNQIVAVFCHSYHIYLILDEKCKGTRKNM
jgi:hypothetical protein